MRFNKSVQGILFLIFAASALAPARAQSATQPAETLTVTVTDKKHNPVNDLKAGDFKVYDNDQPQQITAFSHSTVTACVGLLIDNSGSMRQQHSAVIAAMLDLVKAGNPEDRTFVVNFNDQPYLDQDFTKDVNRVEEGLRRANPRGGTALYDAIIASADHLANTPTCAKRILVIASDGEDNSSRKSLQQTISALQEAGDTVVYAIALPHDVIPNHVRRGPHALEEIVTPTGGVIFSSESNLSDLKKAVQKLAEELRNQYSLTYVLANPPGKGTYHRTRVEVAAPEQRDVKVRTRAGYVARK